MTLRIHSSSPAARTPLHGTRVLRHVTASGLGGGRFYDHCDGRARATLDSNIEELGTVRLSSLFRSARDERFALSVCEEVA